MRRRQRSLTDSSASRGDGYANLVRGMEIDRPFQVISSDISYIRTDEGFEYLCQIRDVASGMILAAGMSDHMKAELVLDTIRKVVLSWVEDTSGFVEVTFPKAASFIVIGAAGMHRRK